MTTYYQLLDLSLDASAAEVKRAFRREIAKYHPDKVQHLGREFQDIAAGKAAELTQAYKTLSDPSARVEYDTAIDGGAAPSSFGATSYEGPGGPSGGRTGEWPRWPGTGTAAPASATGSVFAQERAGAQDLVRKAALVRFRQAVEGEFGDCEEVPLFGFELAVIPKPPMWTLRQPPRILGRFLSQIDGPAVMDSWGMACRMKRDPKRDLCVFVMAPAVAPVGELAAAIAEQRRRPMPAGGNLVLIPVNSKNWSAHVPADAPAVVKSLLARLKS
jgi:hypothetical protein